MNCAAVRCFSGLAALNVAAGVSLPLFCILVSLRGTDFDDARDLFGPGTEERHDQHAVPQLRVTHNNAIGQKEVSLELARRNAAVQVLALGVILLPTADQQ